MIMAARILIDTLALLRGHRPPEDRCVAPSTSALELEFDFNFIMMMMLMIMVIMMMLSVPAKFNFGTKCISRFLNTSILKMGRTQKTSCGAQIFNACGYKTGAHYARRRGHTQRTRGRPRDDGKGGRWVGRGEVNLSAMSGHRHLSAPSSFRMPLGRPM